MKRDQQTKTDDFIDFKSLFEFFFRIRYLLVGSLLVAFLASYMFNNVSTPTYQVRSSILFKDRRNNQIDLSAFLYGSPLFLEDKDFNNEILVIKSNSLVKEVVRSKNFILSYFQRNQKFPNNLFFRLTDIYKDAPFYVEFEIDHPQPVNLLFQIQIINEKEFRLIVDGKEIDIYDYLLEKPIRKAEDLMLNKTFLFGEEIRGADYFFRVFCTSGTDPGSCPVGMYYFMFQPVTELSVSYGGSLTVEPQEPNSTIAKISFRGSNITKAKDFVNSLTSEYVRRSLNNKNHMALATINYIDAQLASISDSLVFTEEELQNFRRDYQVIDMNEKANRLFQQLQSLETEKSELVKKSMLYNQLRDYFERNKDSHELLAPSSLGIEDANLNSLIKELTGLNSDLKALISSGQEKSPKVESLTIQISSLKGTIEENINYIINTSRIQLNDINERLRQIRNEVDRLPQTQRQLLGIERRFNLNDAVYTFLLEKKAEAQIARASNLPDIEIIEEATYDYKVHPKAVRNHLLAFILGIMLPSLFIKLKEVLRTSISSRAEIEKLTEIRIIGRLVNHGESSKNIFRNFAESQIAENFRTLRMNLEFISKGNGKMIILVTSSGAKEGKSFTAINLGGSFARSGRKTVVIGFDLRKPSSLYEEIGGVFSAGLSNYLINHSTIQEVHFPTSVENLYVIPAGPIPPNPFELISSEKSAELIGDLKKQFEIVIIDSPPIGYIPDGYFLMKYSDINLIVVRHLITQKKSLTDTLNEMGLNNDRSHYIVYNDEPLDKIDMRYNYYYQKNKV